MVSCWGLSPAQYVAPNMHEERFSLEFLMELTALSFYFRTIRFVSANAPLEQVHSILRSGWLCN